MNKEDFTNITGFLESFEKLAYQILIWFIMIPKTLWKIISDPGWVPGYVQKELAPNESARFDDYFSPIILFLFVSLVPFVVFNTYQIPGVSIEGPLEGTVGETYLFSTQGDFIWTTPAEYTFTWSVFSNETNEWVNLEAEPYRISGENDKTKDTFPISWDQPGDQWVEVLVTNDLGEVYSYVHPIYIKEADLLVDSTPHNLDTESKKSGTGVGALAGALKGENSLFAGLVFLSFPLIFTLLTDGMGRGDISGTNLKQTFYMQCYYFSPLFLAFYVEELTYWHFYIPGLQTHETMYTATLLLAGGFIVWFIIAETQFVIQVVQKENKRSTGKALLRVIGVILFITFVGLLVTGAATDQDFIRGTVWSIYLLFSFGAILFGLRRWLQNRKSRGDTPATLPTLPDPSLPSIEAEL